MIGGYILEKKIIIENISRHINTAIIILKDNKSIEFINDEAKKTLKIEKNIIYIQDIPDEIMLLIKEKDKIERYEVNLGERIFGISISSTKENGSLYTMIVFKDITEIKRQDQINRQNEKFRLMGEVVVALAHEIKNSLNLIGGFSQLIVESENIDIMKENHRNVLAEVDRLNKMAKNMLDFTRKEKLSKIKFDIVQFTKELTASLDIDEMVDIKSNFENIEVFADYDKMVQVFLNLLRNAVDAVSESEEQKIIIEIIKSDKITIIFENSGNMKDNFDITQIFTPYFTTKTDGNGLGLAITKKIVEEHNGEINVKKNNIGGLTFEIKLGLYLY